MLLKVMSENFLLKKSPIPIETSTGSGCGIFRISVINTASTLPVRKASCLSWKNSRQKNSPRRFRGRPVMPVTLYHKQIQRDTSRIFTYPSSLVFLVTSEWISCQVSFPFPLRMFLGVVNMTPWVEYWRKEIHGFHFGLAIQSFLMSCGIIGLIIGGLLVFRFIINH